MPLAPSTVYAYTFGGFDVVIENHIRQQGFILQSERDTAMLPEANGGPSYVVSPLYDPRTTPITCSDGSSVVYPNALGGQIQASLGSLTSDALKYGAICQGVYGFDVPTYAGNINADDWRLNFDKGDWLQAPTSINSSIKMRRRFSFGDFLATVNMEGLYDSVLMDDDRFDRSGLSSAGKEKVARYVKFDGNAQLSTRVFGHRGARFILGQQEIHWGEQSFLPGGISWFNPLNVPRFRQTGYDDGWIPVMALYSDIRMSRVLSLAGYLGGWNHYQFDVPGTYAGVGGDVWRSGAGSGGNQHHFVIGGGSYFTGNSWPCQYNDASYWQGGSINAKTQEYADALASYAPNCPSVSDVLTPVTIGRAEQERIAAGDSWAMIPRGRDQKGSNSYGLMADYEWRRRFLGLQFSFQGGDARVPMINYQTDKVRVMPYATGVKDGVIARGAILRGLGLYPTNPYNPAYNSVSLNADNQLIETLKSQVSLNTYNATAGSVAEMNAIQFQLATDQSVAVTPSTPQGFEQSGATYTGAVNIRPDFNLNIFGTYPYENIFGLSAKYTAFGANKSPLFMNVAYRPNTPLQFDLNELMIAGLFNNCMMSSTGAIEPSLLNQEPYHNEFDVQRGLDRVGCRDYPTTLFGYTDEYNGWITDLVGQGLYSQRSILGGDNVFGRLQMRSVYVHGISERADMTQKKTINGAVLTGPLMPLESVCVSGSDLPLSALVDLDPRDPIVCRPTQYSMGLLFGGGIDYNHVRLLGQPYTVTPGVFIARGMVGRSPRPLGAWIKGVGYYIVGFEIKNNQRLRYEVQYRGYFGSSLYNLDIGADALSLTLRYNLNMS